MSAAEELTRPWTVFAWMMLAHVVLQLHMRRSRPDWDSASHLFQAFLLNRRVDCPNSYSFGVKWGLPRLYALMWPMLEADAGRFRLVNFVAGALSLALIVASAARVDGHVAYPSLCLIAVLVVDSCYVNAPTSAAEFSSAPLACATLLLGDGVPGPAGLVIQIAAVCGIALVFKLVDLAYLLPVLVQNEEVVLGQPLLLAPCAVLVASTLVLIMRKRVKSLSRYASSRGLVHPKSKLFIECNPLFVLSLVVLTVVNFRFGDVVVQSTLVCCVVALLAQRMLVFYFWYPLALFNLVFAAQLDWYARLEGAPGWALAAFVALWHTVPFLAFRPTELLDGYVRGRYFRPLRKLRNARAVTRNTVNAARRQLEQVALLRREIPRGASVYLWGSKTALMLEARLVPLDRTYYTHNHLFYWTGIEDPASHAAELVSSRAPDFVIEAGVIEGQAFPAARFQEQYEQAHGLYDMRVFRRRPRAVDTEHGVRQRALDPDGEAGTRRETQLPGTLR